MTVTKEATTRDGVSTPRWLSANEDRAWGERFFLLYTPVWILATVVFTTFAPLGSLTDIHYVLFGLVVAGPMLAIPAVSRRGRNPDGKWYHAYWFKANLYIFVVQVIGNYFGSEYFFDVLGMIYDYPNIHLNADSALLGTGQQHVPILMYFLTQATYMTYHSTAAVVLRRIVTSRIQLRWLMFAVGVAVLSYAWAWTETFSFTNGQVSEGFGYRDEGAMLAYGSIVFGLALLPSFPIFYFLDERADRRWSLFQVIGGGLSAGMLMMLLTDVATHAIGTI